MMKNFIFLFVLLFSAASFSQQTCQTVVETLAGKPVTIAEVSNSGKKIPTILVNINSVRELDPLFEKSLGIVVIHQKDYKNDHGMIRVGPYFIDRDAPGHRARGEILDTGLAWASVEEYVDFNHNRGGYNRIEVLFSLTDAEYQTAMTYQMMRRAAIVRPDFRFGNVTNPTDTNNVLDDCGEICFSFSTGSAINQQISSITRKLQSYKLENLKELQNSAEVKKLITHVKNYLFEMRLKNYKVSPKVAYKFEIPQKIKDLNMEHEQELEFINWLIGLEISQEYQQLLTTLSIQNSNNYSNITSARASAVLVYDGNTKLEMFLNPEYTSQGIFSTWKNQGITLLQDGTKITPEINENLTPFQKIQSFVTRMLKI